MAELLHCCDKELNTIEPVDRNIVHKEGIWHKTSHVWLYDDEGYVYFQVRADADKLYTSASGHVLANEDPKDTAVRETLEELGIKIQKDELDLLKITSWKFDNEVKHDHVYAYIYTYKVDSKFTEYTIDNKEVTGIVKMKAEQLLHYLLGMPVYFEQLDVYGNIVNNKKLLLMEGEHAILKYGDILQEIVKKTMGA